MAQNSPDGELRDTIDNPVLLLSLVAGVLLSLCIGVVARIETGSPPGFSPKPFAHLLGKPAPPFEIEGVDGTSVTLESTKRGDVKVLLFTDSMCKACDVTYPSLKKAAMRLPVLVVGIGDRRELEEKLQDVPVVIGFDSVRAVVRSYQVRTFPSALLIDQHGIVLHAARGTRSVNRVVAAWDGWSKVGGNESETE